VTRKGKKLDVVLEETGPATGVFAAIVKTTPDGTPMDGMLEVADNDTIIARYVDQLPAAGTLKNAYEARVSLAKTNGSMTVGIEYPNPALKDPANLDPERAKRIPPVLFSQALRVENNTTLTVRVDDRDLDKTDGKDSVTVQVAAASGATLPVVLTETGERTGVFAGSFKLMTNATAPSPKFLAAKPGDVVTITYTDTENPSDRPVAVPMQIKANILEDATVAIEHQVTIPADPANPKSRATTLWQPATMLIPGTLYRLSILDGDIVPPPGQTLARPFTLKASNGATLDLDLRGSVDKMTFGAAFSTEFYVRLGDRKSPQTTIITREGAVAENDEGGPTTVEGRAVPTINVQGTDTVDGTYIETVNAAGKKDQKLVKPFKVAADGTVALLDVLGGPLRTLKPGVSFVVKVVDPSGDLNPTPDKLKVKIVSTTGDTLADVEMHETGGHSGVFLAEVKTAVQKAADAEMTINIDFGGSLTATYTDVETVAGAPADRTAAITADDLLTAQAMLLTKVFDDEKFEEEALARLCESLYSLGAMELAATKLDPAQPRTNARLKEAGRLLGRLLERFPTSDYVVQALYLKGKISREERNYPDAKDLFTRIIDQYETTPFAPLAMNEMVGIAVDEKDIDAAIEMTKRLAHGFPTSSTVPEAFRRVADFYYRQKGTGYGTAASIYERMLVRFPDFKGIDGIRFRLATIYYNMGMADARNLDAFNKAGQHYLDYAKLYPNSDLADDALYWGASCYWKVPNAVRAYTMIMRLVGQYPGSDQVRGAELMKEQIRLANKGIEIDPELF
jgi:TolA-binding protein